MIYADYNLKTDYDFGTVYFYDSYVVGEVGHGYTVDTRIAKAILSDINTHFGKKKIVYVSNRLFGHDVDLDVYKLVDHKRLVGIAIVAEGRDQRHQALSEQLQYEGSFCFFNNMDSAISWARSFSASKAV